MSQSSASAKRWEPPSIEELSEQLPQYKIEALLGRGGMGAVYKGRQITLDRPVAIKILPLEMGERDATYAQRFKNEARAMAKLNHPGIVAVYDFGETSAGLLYFVMELIEGTDVAKMIVQQGRLRSEHAMAITAHVCDALGYAHNRGILHRDIKPANIMVGYDGVVKVADFGLAKVTDEGESGMTRSCVIMGTLHYMAPEALILGIEVDNRADIYAVGVMLYQMLTGKLPQGMFEMPSLQVKGLDPRYDKIVVNSLREDRELRYSSASALRLELDAILTQPVLKVEESAKEAPAALETQARPKRPVGSPPGNRHADEVQVVLVPSKKSHGALVMMLLAMMLGLGAFVAYQKDVPSGSSGGEKRVQGPEQSANGPEIPSAATRESPFVNTLGMKFVPVPILDGPTKGMQVLFSVWETRVRDFEMFLKESRHEWSNSADIDQRLDHAIAGVSWDDAQAFCTWLTQRERVDGAIHQLDVYRLPSDYEWSCAVGIGEMEDASKSPSERSDLGNFRPAIYPWGSQWPPSSNSGNYWSEELRPLLAAGKFSYLGGQLPGYFDGQATVGPVGSYKANQFGLFDLGGNVTEWCIDWFSAEKQFRVLRGGSWHFSARAGLLSSRRYPSSSNTRNGSGGFRCVFESAAQNRGSTSTLVPIKGTYAPIGHASRYQNLSQVMAAISKLAPDTAEATVNELSSGGFRVDVSGLPITDFTPLHGMGVKNLQANRTAISDLSSVIGVGMEQLWLIECGNLKDLAPLANCRSLTNLNLSGSPVSHLAPLRGLRLSSIAISRTRIKDLSPLRGMPLKGFYCVGSDSDFDVSPLSECVALEEITIPKSAKNIESLRRLPALRYISHGFDFSAKPQRPAQTAAEFWAEFDQVKMGAHNYPQELVALAIQFDALRDSKVTSVYEKDLASLNKNYSGGLGRAIAAEKSIKRFDELDSLENEKKLADTGSKISVAGAAGTGRVLANLRSVYHKSLASLEAESQKNLKALVDPLTKRLEQMEADLAKEKRLTDAQRVKEYRLNLPQIKLESLDGNAPTNRLPTPNSSAIFTLSATKENPYVNSLGMKFVPVPETKVFFCIWETRFRDYERFAKENPADAERKPTGQFDLVFEQGADYPVGAVRWSSAKAFCEWLTKKERMAGLLPDDATYRLPKEAEWMKAVADELESQRPNKPNGNVADEAFHRVQPDRGWIRGFDDGFASTAIVGSFTANLLGIYDLQGNVWEWCEDFFDPSAGGNRLLLGGACTDSGFRHGTADNVDGDIGFRIVIELP